MGVAFRVKKSQTKNLPAESKVSPVYQTNKTQTMNEKDMAHTIINDCHARMENMLRLQAKRMAERDVELGRVKGEREALAKEQQALTDAYQNIQTSLFHAYEAAERQRRNIKALQDAIPLYKESIRQEKQRIHALKKNTDTVALKVKAELEENESNS